MPRDTLVDSRFAGIRRNLALNPRPATAITGWLNSPGTGGAGTVALVTTVGAGPGGSTGVARLTVTTPPTGGSTGVYHRTGLNTNPGGLVGDVITMSMWVKAPVASRMRMSAQLRSGGTNVGTSGLGPFVTTPAGVWTRISTTFTADVPYDELQAWGQIESPQTVMLAGQTWDFASLLMEKSPVLGPYFDGAMRNAKWVGTADASHSVGNGYAGRT